jgi:hypothetical protein
MFGKALPHGWAHLLCLVLAKTVQTSSARNDNNNSSTPNGSKFVSKKTEQVAENQEEYFIICLSR